MARKASKSRADQAAAERGAQRRIVYFAALVAVMTGTGALLLALAPAPLTPGASFSLFAVGTPDSLDKIFETNQPLETDRWRHIYVHHSQSPAGNAATLGESAAGLGDHFVIGNGDGCGDGEVQIAQRWLRQGPAGRVQGLDRIEADCISICLIGDFDRGKPTPTQVLRLTQLVNALQDRCGIPAERVVLVNAPSSPAGIGRHFPASALQAQLLN